MALAVYDATARMNTNLDQPIRIELPFADISGWKFEDPALMKLPFPFRD
jgi:hypothetical protein